MKSFHEAKNAKMPTVALIGANNGKIRVQNVCQVVAPSMRALSSSSAGIDLRNAVNNRTLKLNWNTMWRRVTPHGLSRWASPVSWIWGSATTGNGMKRAARR